MRENILREDLMNMLFGGTHAKAKDTEAEKTLGVIDVPREQVLKILREASKNPELLESIQERASIRWADGLSDSLYDAVLCNIKPLGEKPERDEEGKIILRPCTDWEAELKKYS